jgi:hypothetical protein
MTTEKVDIILPNRIGDTILTLPSLLCLKQLREKYGPAHREYRLVSGLPFTEVLQSLNLFRVVRMNKAAKIKSWMLPADKAFFLSTTSKNLGFHARISYGLRLPNKRYIGYSVHTPYLSFPEQETVLPEDLVSFLESGFQFSSYTIKHFGICLELDYTVDQIRQTFRFDSASLSFPDEFYDWKSPIKEKYLVFCMEAASGRKKHNADRRWKEEYFLDLAEKAYQKHGMMSAFIGIDDMPELPDRPYFHDLRRKLSLKQTALLLHHSCGYVGNDTGPLHMANLMKKPSIVVYLRDMRFCHGPLFPHLATKFLKPQKPEDIYPALDKLVLHAV